MQCRRPAWRAEKEGGSLELAGRVLEGLRGKELLDLGAKERLLCLCKEVDSDAFFFFYRPITQDDK